MKPEETCSIIKFDTVESMRTIVFVSDLHLDLCAYKTGGDKKLANEYLRLFVEFIEQNHKEDILLLGGDCFNDPVLSLLLYFTLEAREIRGFFVLGNHEYRMRGKTMEEVEKWYWDKTKDHKYFRMLKTGNKYQLDGHCFIGDTGWTSLVNEKETLPPEEAIKHLDVYEYLEDFNIEQIVRKHEEWVAFANETMSNERNVVALTHFPMTETDSARVRCSDGCSMWSSATNLELSDESWLIYGHTHTAVERIGNRVCCQYYGFARADGRNYEGMVGILAPRSQSQELLKEASERLMAGYYAGLGRSSFGDGYKRTSANMDVVREYAVDRAAFIKAVEEKINASCPEERSGLTYLTPIPLSVIEDGKAALAILKEPSFLMSGDIRVFVVALVVCGYFYNGMPYELMYMRRVDDPDIVRFALALLTRIRFDVPVDFRGSTRANKKTGSFQVCGETVYLPTVDGRTLSREDLSRFAPLMQLLDESSLKSLPASTRTTTKMTALQIQRELERGATEDSLSGRYKKSDLNKARLRKRREEIGLEGVLGEFVGVNFCDFQRVCEYLGLGLMLRESSGLYMDMSPAKFVQRTSLEVRRKWFVREIVECDEGKMRAKVSMSYEGDRDWEGTCPFHLDIHGGNLVRSIVPVCYDDLDAPKQNLVDSFLPMNRSVAAALGYAPERLTADSSPMVRYSLRFSVEGCLREERATTERELTKGERKTHQQEYFYLGFLKSPGFLSNELETLLRQMEFANENEARGWAKHENRRIRSAAFERLGVLGVDVCEYFESLAGDENKAVTDESITETKKEAIQSGWVGEFMKSDPNVEVRAELARCGFYLEALINDESSEVRYAAAGHAEYARYLILDEDEKVSRRALRAARADQLTYCDLIPKPIIRTKGRLCEKIAEGSHQSWKKCGLTSKYEIVTAAGEAIFGFSPNKLEALTSFLKASEKADIEVWITSIPVQEGEGGKLFVEIKREDDEAVAAEKADMRMK